MASVAVTLALKTASWRREMETARADVKKFKETVSRGGGLLGGAIAAGGFVAFGKQVLDFAGNLADSAAAMKMNVEELQGLRAAFRGSGTSAESFDRSMVKLNERISDALAGNAAAVESFGTLGVGIDDLRTKSPGAILMMMADGFQSAGDRSHALAAAMELLGKGGRTMAAGLSAGADGLAQLADTAEKLTEPTVQALDAIGDKTQEVFEKMKVKGAQAMGGLLILWDKFARTLGAEKLRTGTLDAMVQAINTDGKQNVAGAASARPAANGKLIAETDALFAGLKSQELANAREMMDNKARLVSLEKERVALLEKAGKVELNESLKLRTEAEKRKGEIAKLKKQMGDEAIRHQEAKDAEDARADEEFLAKRNALDDREKDAKKERADQKNEHQENLREIKTQQSASVLQSMIDEARMSPAERAANRTEQRRVARATARAERAFVRKFGEEELRRVKDAADPAKQAEAAHKKALAASEAKLEQIRMDMQNLGFDMK